VQSLVVVPANPLDDGEFDLVAGSPGLAVDQHGFATLIMVAALVIVYGEERS
jgi:hypothetical protein